jgi:hypothetical protein
VRIEKAIAVIFFAALLAFAGGMQFASSRFDTSQAKMIAQEQSERATTAEQILSLNRLVVVWQNKADACEHRQLSAAPVAIPDRPVASVPVLHGMYSLQLRKSQ